MKKKMCSLLLAMCLLIVTPNAVAETQTVSGVGHGNQGEIAVSVTLTDGKITDVVIDSHNETPGISDAAIAKIPEAIVAAGTVEVDTVSGATATSEGIIEAVSNALNLEAKQNETMTVAEVYEEKQAWFAENAKKYASEIRTLDNGVRIQRTPQTQSVKGTYNNQFLHADERGCAACHTDLTELVDNMKCYPHQKLSTSLDVEMTVMTCTDCHNYGAHVAPFGDFGALIHALHTNTVFDTMGGTCWSCHYASEGNGEMELWDEVKHEVMLGINKLTADAISYEFDWDQTTVLMPMVNSI